MTVSTTTAASSTLRHRVDAGLDQLVLAVPATTPLVLIGDRALARARRGSDPQAGASVLELVVISAIVLAVALTIGAIVRNKLVTKANGLDLTTPGAS